MSFQPYTKEARPQANRKGGNFRQRETLPDDFYATYVPTKREVLFPWELKYLNGGKLGAGFYAVNRDTREERFLNLTHFQLHRDDAADRVTSMNLRNEAEVLAARATQVRVPRVRRSA